MSNQALVPHVLLSTAVSATGTWYPLNYSNNDYIARNIWVSLGAGASMIIETTPDAMYVNGLAVAPVNLATAASTAVSGKQWIQVAGPFVGIRARCTGSGKAKGLL